VAEFNRGEFYACHDTLEALWTEANEPERTFFQGLLQLAVACYHLERQNQRGAILLLGEGCRRLQPYLPDYGGIDLEALITQAQALLLSLQTNRLDEHPARLFISTCPGRDNPDIDNIGTDRDNKA